MMSSSSSNSMASDLLGALEARAKEIELLKRQLQQSEKERIHLESLKHVFESKQPLDVQTLAIQKRELQTQLEREESEKHELFSQINQLIGEIAQLRGSENSSEENKKIINALETQLREVQAEISELKRDFGRKERDFQLVVEELSMLKVERDRRERAFELERGRITDELNDAHFEMEKLQKQICNKPQNEDTSEASGLIEKLEALENELQEKDDLLREMTESNDELGRSLSETSSRLDHVQIEYAQLSDKFKSGSKSSNESEAELRKELDATKNQLEQVKRTNFEELNSLRRRLSIEAESRKKSEEILRAKELEVENLRKEKKKLSEEVPVHHSNVREKIHRLESQTNPSDLDAEDLRDQILKFESEISEKNLLIEKEQRVRNIAEESLSELGRKYDHLLEAEKIYKKEAGELKMKLDETLAAKSFTESSRLKLQQELDTSRVKNIAELKESLDTGKIKRRQIEREYQERIQELEKLLDYARSEMSQKLNNSSEAASEENNQLKQKMSELVNENTRLSADLLEQQINSEKEFKQLLSREQSRWVQRTADKDRELDELKKRIESLIAERQTQAESPVPLAKPRKLVNGSGGDQSAPLSPGSGGGYGAEDATALEKLTAELEKNRRIVTVLRKKLQKQLIEERIREKNAAAVVVTASTTTCTNPFDE